MLKNFDNHIIISYITKKIMAKSRSSTLDFYVYGGWERGGRFRTLPNIAENLQGSAEASKREFVFGNGRIWGGGGVVVHKTILAMYLICL